MNGLANASASSKSTASRSESSKQIAQAAVLDRALRAPLEKHQRAERLRRSSDGAAAGADRRAAPPCGAGQKPGSQKAHQNLPCRIVRYSRRAPSSGLSVTSR